MIPTLFIGSQRSDVIYWDFTDSLDVMQDYIPEICSYELLEAYLNVSDVLKQYYHCPNIPAIRLTNESHKMIKRDQLYLSGESMGLAWLIGGVCWLKGKDFPKDLYAWGAIKPIRNGRFSLFPTASTRKKVNLSGQNDKKVIVFQHSERVRCHFPGRVFRLKSDLKEVLRQLEIMIDAY